MNIQYQIIDKQVSHKPAIFNSLQELVTTLERVVQYKFKLTRNQYMQNLIDLGYGMDDAIGRTFTESMSECVEIGVIKNNSCVRCNIHEVAHHAKYINEMGH